MNKNLIFDIGANTGQDTAYYLSKGYRVLAVDASPEMIEKIATKFDSLIESEQLELLNYAISDRDNEVVDFYLSENTDWHSLNKDISNRLGKLVGSTKVQTITLSSLVSKYGIPYYCKIDIEGYDNVALASLSGLNELPKYISVESECIDDTNHNVSEEEVLATLNQLYALGYRKFKLVDQMTLKVLPHKTAFYSKRYPNNLTNRILKRLKLLIPKHKNIEHLSEKHDFPFPQGGTGPFGEQLDGRWLKYEEAKNHIIMHRNDFFSMENKRSYDFWCDWHATY